MGTWTITIEGHGIHHNGRQDDAEVMASVFVGELLAAGHGVSQAKLVLTGGTTDVLVAAPSVTTRYETFVGEDKYHPAPTHIPELTSANAVPASV